MNRNLTLEEAAVLGEGDILVFDPPKNIRKYDLLVKKFKYLNLFLDHEYLIEKVLFENDGQKSVSLLEKPKKIYFEMKNYEGIILGTFYYKLFKYKI